MSKQERIVSVEIPEDMANDIQSQPWFKYYNDLSDFVREAVRSHIIRVKAK